MAQFRRFTVGAALAGVVLVSGATLAQQSGHSGHGTATQGMATGAEAPSTAAYKAANMQMHKDMSIAYTGDSDVDFVRGMIPHHQGAVAMAKVELAHGKDPELRKLAENIIADQEKEIALMQGWLKKNGK